jgi:hypothetical protein
VPVSLGSSYLIALTKGLFSSSVIDIVQRASLHDYINLRKLRNCFLALPTLIFFQVRIVLDSKA